MKKRRKEIVKKKDTLTDEEMDIETISEQDKNKPIEYQEGDIFTEIIDGREVKNIYHNGEWVPDTTDLNSDVDEEDDIEPTESPVSEDNPLFNNGFAAIADLLNNNKNSVNTSYSYLFQTTLKLFEENDNAHDSINNSIKFIAENIDDLISQLNKYKKNTEMKLRLLFLMNVLAWIALIVKVF